MSDVVIRVEGLGKKYRIRHQRREHYTTLRDVIADGARRIFRGRARNSDDSGLVEDFWALKGVSFDIGRGEIVGVIGRNGAGKSTLLKILSRITEPTAGRVEIEGRVASLLEVGTGFHPELTGRENIFLNGAILGMTRAEVRGRFDEIVAFAEVEKFLDTPVKRYSSGMYGRLAFAIAAHLEPEILIVDEVLAVGDAAFQNKCLGRMKDISRSEGRTVIFVSHNITAVTGICTKGVFLSGGEIAYQGPTDLAADAYAKSSLAEQSRARVSGETVLRAARLNSQTESSDSSNPGVVLDFDFDLDKAAGEIGIDLIVRQANDSAAILFGSSAYFGSIRLGEDVSRVTCTLGPVNIAMGSYHVDVRICVPMVKWVEEHDSILEFSIERQSGARRGFQLAQGRQLGSVVPKQVWSLR